MKLAEGARMPIVFVDDAMHDDYSCIAMFFGEGAYTRAVNFIGTLDEYMSGRYGVSICDVECTCGETFWHEAWEGTHSLGEWRSPCCQRVFTAEEIEDMTTPIPELES